MSDDYRIQGSDGQPRCPHCGAIADDDHRFCPQCGTPLGDSVYDEAAAVGEGRPVDSFGRPIPGHGTDELPVGSSGRNPWSNMTLAEQRAYLDGEPPSFSRDGGDFLHRLGAADDLVERCERDLDQAAEAMRMANAFIRDEHLHERSASLSPEERSEYVDLLNRKARWEAATAALEAARTRQAALLRTYEQIGSLGEGGPSRSSIFRERPPGLLDPDRGDW
jgi:hypothetical protein